MGHTERSEVSQIIIQRKTLHPIGGCRTEKVQVKKKLIALKKYFK